MLSSKAPGTDGIQALFYQNHWHIIGESVCKMVKEAFANPALQICTRFMRPLIPKKENPEMLKEFRPISLCKCNLKDNIEDDCQSFEKASEQVNWQPSVLIAGRHSCDYSGRKEDIVVIIVEKEVIHSMQ